MSNISKHSTCYVRHANGNCLRYGGFCSSVSENLCEKVHAETISRQAAIEAINTWPKFGCDEHGRIVPWNENYVPYVHLEDVITAITKLPTIEERKTGHWLMPNKTHSDKIWRKCSSCGTHVELFSEYKAFDGTMHYFKYVRNYCPICGAKMEAEHERFD